MHFVHLKVVGDDLSIGQPPGHSGLIHAELHASGVSAQQIHQGQGVFHLAAFKMLCFLPQPPLPARVIPAHGNADKK